MNFQYSSLPKLPQSLQKLYCPYTQIRSLPAPLPQSLKELDCSNTRITTLPALPQGLQLLYCSHTQIRSLPAPLPPGLQKLYCASTLITSLPTLPQGLQKLYCPYTQITGLPVLPQDLEELYCYNTQITSLPVLPESLQVLDYYETPFEKSLPGLLKYIINMDEQDNFDERFHFNIHDARTSSLMIEIVKFWHEIKQKDKKIEELEEQIRIMPGGSEYFKAMGQYEQRREQALNKN